MQILIPRKFSVTLDCCQLILQINVVEGKRLSRNRETGIERLPRWRQKFVEKLMNDIRHARPNLRTIKFRQQLWGRGNPESEEHIFPCFLWYGVDKCRTLFDIWHTCFLDERKSKNCSMFTSICIS